AHVRSMICAVHTELLLRHSLAGAVWHSDLFYLETPLLFPVLVIKPVVLLFDSFEILADGIDSARGMHPPRSVVESLVDEELPPGYCAIRIQPLFAHHLQLGPEEERRVRVN